MEEQEQTKKRIKVSVPDIYRKVDDTVWQELEQYLFTGFLTAPASIGGTNFVFKSLNHMEVRNIEYLKPCKASLLEARAQFRAAFIAYSSFMINGNNTIFDRPRHISRLIKTISKISAANQDKIIENLSYLNERASRLFPLTEIYVYENRSRFKWFQLGENPIHDPRYTGISGTDNLGMNLCQSTWMSLNKIIDRRETVEREWSNAKFVGSCFAGKGIRSIDERDKNRLERERQNREEKKINTLYNYLNRTSDKEAPRTVSLPDGRLSTIAKRFKAESAEELAEELSAALSGEKDYHDLIIEQKEKEFQERQKSMEDQRIKIFQASPLSDSGIHSTRVLGGKQEAESMVRRMESLRLEQIAKNRKSILPDDPEDSDDPDNMR